tara:strand:+ start:149 stop:574 length:426 start_codon:yes stop_codon:yes gene_type:complete
LTDNFSFDEKIEFLKNLGCDDVGHNNQTLLDHLMGVHKLLKSWDTPEYVQDAGLFHSVYGTIYFKPQMITNRNIIQGIIGFQAEVLSYIYCILSAPRIKGILKIEDDQTKQNLLLINRANEEDMASTNMMTWEEAYNMKEN